MFDTYQQRQRERPWRRNALVVIAIVVVGGGGLKLYLNHQRGAQEQDAERARSEREKLDAPGVVQAEGFSFEAPGSVERRSGDYSAGSVQGGGRSTGFGAMWSRELSLDDPASRADVIARLAKAFQRPVEPGAERRIELAGGHAYAIELRSRDSAAFPYIVALTLLACDHRLVALWVDRESSVEDENQALLSSYRCTPASP